MGFKASVIIPSLGRPDTLKLCLESLKAQTCQPEEVIVIEEEGELAALRNQGARKAKGDILVFIDDDTVCSRSWLFEILRSFQEKVGVVGVSGPAVIDSAHMANRDLFRFHWIKQFYDWVFLDGKSALPGHFTKAGAWTTGACEESCSYEGKVDFLEACNMAWEAKAFNRVGGFDESYHGIGDWSEPDLAFRVRYSGGRLWFNPRARLEHRPSKTGAFSKRRHTDWRLKNYWRFSDRWIEPCWQHTFYKGFLWSYYQWKELNSIFGL